MRHLPWLALVLVATASAASCGGGQTRAHPLDQSWDDEKGTELDAFQRGWDRPEVPAAPEVAIGLVDDRTVIGLDLGAKKRWIYEYDFEGRPVLTGDVLVGVGSGYLFALDPLNGERRWWRKAQGWLRGVGDDGKTTVVTLEGITGEHSVVLAVDRSGRIVRQVFEHARIGSPAVFDQFVFLPYERRQVVIFDLVSGTETARVVSSRPVSRAFISRDHLYFGHEGAIAFDDAIVEARSGGGTLVTPPSRNFPGAPRWLAPGDEALPMRTVRHDSVRFLYLPGDPGATLLYHRLAIGLDEGGRTRWVHTADAHHVGGVAGPGVITVCDAAGRIRWLDARRGNVLGRADLGQSVRACLVQSTGPRELRPESSAPLEDQLYLALQFSDPLHLPIQLELLDDLDRIAGDRATAVMIALARETPRTAAAATLGRLVRERLARRRSGTSALRDALDELNQRWRPTDLPVAEIASALRLGGVVASADALGMSLHHPYLEPAARLSVALALSALATRGQVIALSSFAARHACPPTDAPPEARRTLEVVFKTLERLGAEGPASRARQGCPPADKGGSVAPASGDTPSGRSRAVTPTP